MNGQPPKPHRGCFFYGCITSLVLLALVLCALLVGLHYAKKLINRYTDTRPMELPTVQMSPAEVAKVKHRVEEFKQALQQQHPVAPLVLSADDVNALIANGPERELLKGKFYLNFEGDQLKGDISLPLHELGVPLLRGRYLNGSASFDLAFRDGTVVVNARDITVKGKPLPENFLRDLRKENLAAELTKQPDTGPLLKRLQDIQVKDNQLIFVPKSQP